MTKRIYYAFLIIVTLACIVVGTAYHNYNRRRYENMYMEAWSEEAAREEPVSFEYEEHPWEEEGDTDEEFSRLHIYMESGNAVIQSGDAVVITGAGISSSNTSWYQEGADLYVIGGSSRVVITVPEDMVLSYLDISMGSGDAAISDISASEASIYSISGDIAMTCTNLENGYVSTESGDIAAVSLSFGTLEVNSQSGKVTLTDTQGLGDCSIDLSSGSGKIVYGGIEGNHFTKYGSDGRSLSIWTESGNIVLS